jgi:hypothetical protein
MGEASGKEFKSSNYLFWAGDLRDPGGFAGKTYKEMASWPFRVYSTVFWKAKWKSGFRGFINGQSQLSRQFGYRKPWALT